MADVGSLWIGMGWTVTAALPILACLDADHWFAFTHFTSSGSDFDNRVGFLPLDLHGGTA